MTNPLHTETITVIAKTYPEQSKKYGYLVCVAGINSDGEWRRLYPIPFALFYQRKYSNLRFKKWDIISVKMRKRPRNKDYREESHEVRDPSEIRVVGSMPTWAERRQLVKKHLDSSLEMLSEVKRSLGVIKPREVLEFREEERKRLEEKEDLEVLDKLLQLDLSDFMTSGVPRIEPRIIPEQLPWLGYKYLCQNSACSGHKMMCIDWELQELYRKVGFEKTKRKVLDWMLEKRDLFFAVGTTKRFARWMIISLIYPPEETVTL